MTDWNPQTFDENKGERTNPNEGKVTRVSGGELPKGATWSERYEKETLIPCTLTRIEPPPASLAGNVSREIRQIELWKAIREALLCVLDAVEKYIDHHPRTSEIRKAYKRGER
jgi:hypothetical protein